MKFRGPKAPIDILRGPVFRGWVTAITLETSWDLHPHVSGYCFRALVEVLLASATRIGEALSLNRYIVDGE